MKTAEVRIATPCGESWEKMTPEGGGRLCAACDKVVHDLSSLSEARARRLMASKGNLCVRYLYDEHGNIWFAGDEPPLAARLLNRAKRGAAVAAALAAPLTLQACWGSMPDEPGDTYALDAGSPEDDAGHIKPNPVVIEDGGADASSGDGDAAIDAGDDDAGDGG